MDTTISNRPDVVAASTAPRPTAPPPSVPFAQVLAAGARTMVRGADQAITALPGGPLMAVALRGGATAPLPMAPLSSQMAPSPRMPASTGVTPEGPGTVAGASGALGGAAGLAGVATGGAGDGIDATLAQSQAMNLYYLQIQETVNQQNRTYTALSDVLKAEHDTMKTAIGNIH